MADFPAQGGSEGAWGTELIAFFAEQFQLSDITGATGGHFGALVHEGEVLCFDGEILTYVEN